MNAETVLTFAWDITWYQYRVSPEAAQPVRIADGATTWARLIPPYTDWNARLDDHGRLIPSSRSCRRRPAAVTHRHLRHRLMTTIETPPALTCSSASALTGAVSDGDLVVSTPITGEEIARVAWTTEAPTPPP